jgi:hypothetical protein
MNWLSDLVCWFGCKTNTCGVLDLLQPALQNRLGAWAIIAVLTVVWSVLVVVAIEIFLIAHAGGKDDSTPLPPA